MATTITAILHISLPGSLPTNLMDRHPLSVLRPVPESAELKNQKLENGHERGGQCIRHRLLSMPISDALLSQ
jgi:hypothetical protein